MNITYNFYAKRTKNFYLIINYNNYDAAIFYISLYTVSVSNNYGAAVNYISLNKISGPLYVC